jgi:hypothetical protein
MSKRLDHDAIEVSPKCDDGQDRAIGGRVVVRRIWLVTIAFGGLLFLDLGVRELARLGLRSDAL